MQHKKNPNRNAALSLAQYRRVVRGHLIGFWLMAHRVRWTEDTGEDIAIGRQNSIGNSSPVAARCDAVCRDLIAIVVAGWW